MAAGRGTDASQPEGHGENRSTAARARGIRKRYRDRVDHTGGMEQYGDTSHDTVVDAIGVWEAFNRLPLHPADRRLIQMTRLQGHTLAEAAQELGISLTAATSRRNRAEQRLAAHFAPRRTTTLHLPEATDQARRATGSAGTLPDPAPQSIEATAPNLEL